MGLQAMRGITLLLVILLSFLLMAVSGNVDGAVAKLEINRMTWKGFISLVSTLLEIDNKIDVSPNGNLLLQLGQVKGMHVRRCKTVVVGNPNCHSQRNIKLLCPFTCELLNASLYQRVSLRRRLVALLPIFYRLEYNFDSCS
ncbi:unnamed protein product [Schistocephalus solidus]|uniref:Secreted protein n=1 Tax=Schistocephalus solidus TaxID=70667 RepID=A0A183TH12_SCHSO|nr:unnamed protein product [Schistocephalus solidus]